MTMLACYAILHDVITALDWWKLAPNNALTHHGTLCLADPDARQYLLYVRCTDAIHAEATLPRSGNRHLDRRKPPTARFCRGCLDWPAGFEN